MKKTVIPVVLALLLVLSGCGAAVSDSSSLGDYLVTRSLAQSRIAGEMAGAETYITLYGLSDEVAAVVADIAEVDYTSPRRAVIVSGAGDAIRSYVEAEMGRMDDDVYGLVENRMYGSLPAILNGGQGQWVLVATSMLYVERAYQRHADLAGNVHVILLYEGDYSTITTFMSSEEDTVIATTAVVALADDIVQALGTGALDGYLDALLPTGGIVIEYMDF